VFEERSGTSKGQIEELQGQLSIKLQELEELRSNTLPTR
jgi:hypothetical protein